MALAGCVVGFAFLTKMLQAFLHRAGPRAGVPGRRADRAVEADGRVAGRRASTMVVSAGWYIALVSLWPAGSRPYIAGSTDNSLLQLAFGYNGIERITGGEGPAGGGSGGPGGGGLGGGNLFFGGDPGIGRMFGPSFGAEASWLLPAALIGLVAACGSRGAPRAPTGCGPALLLWGGWLLVTGAVFSFMDGIVHPYYTVALAPAIAALVGISVRELWRRKALLAPRIVLAVMLAVTGVWAFVLLDRTPDWMPALRWVVLVGSVMVAAVLVVGAAQAGPRHRRGGRRGSAFRARRARRRSRSTTPVAVAQRPGTMSGPAEGGRFRRLRRPRRRRRPGGPGRVATTPRWNSWSRAPTTVGRQPVSGRSR